MQPFYVPGNLVRFAMPRTRRSWHGFRWTPDRVVFQSARGRPADSGALIHEWVTTQSVPPAGGENVRMNLWLLPGRVPKRAARAIIERFEFIPEP